jgi:hypothetical protein
MNSVSTKQYGVSIPSSFALHAQTVLLEVAQSGFGVGFLATLHFV